MTALAPTLQAFFTDRLARQRQASPHTIAAYRDTLRLLLGFAAQRTGTQPSTWTIADLDAPLIAAFLDHLEHERGNSVRTRNARLAAIHSLFRFAALRHPEHAAIIQRVLAIPPKRFDRALVTYLTEPEVDALLAAPDTDTWTGRRDHALLLLAIQTGLRVSELTALTCADVHLGVGAHVNCQGKGRKQRITPLTTTTDRGHQRLARRTPRRAHRPAVPHPPRHRHEPRRRRTAARHTRRDRRSRRTDPGREEDLTARAAPHRRDAPAAAGVDTTVIALWLGHESVATTQIYLHADLALKEQALARTAPIEAAARPLPTLRRRHGLPRQPLIMPTSAPRSPPPAAAPASTSA